MRKHSPCGYRSQQGQVLIIGLILLVVMTLIGVTAMRTTTLEEKMAGNQRDQNLAFQAAESALREGEDVLKNITMLPVLEDATNGVVWRWSKNGPDGDVSNSYPWWQERDASWWNSAASHSVALSTSTLKQVSAQPRYLIENQMFVRDSLVTTSYSRPPSGWHFHRVTARGQGGSQDAVVLLQSSFSWRYQ